ncbi:MAG: DNA-directed RNA polymerase subunit beta [Deltaproteobacteria bacterium]|nr:MAG: DNA-directed RNA polymerase subunit beta [Deltaproteobacteria bacterium]
MPQLLANNFKYRSSFSKTPNVVDVGNLIEIQRASYEAFLQPDVAEEDRKEQGLQAVFRSVFPIQDFSGKAQLQFRSYELEPPKYDVDECRERGMTYSAPIKVVVRLVVWDIDEDTEARTVSNIKEQPVYFGEIPLMTENGTFIINGTERVVVSQLHRSPGIFFDSHRSKTGGAKEIFTARIIPNRGSWIDFEFDSKDILYVRIDRRRKLPATVLLRALGYDTEALLNYFYESERIFRTDAGWFKETTADLLFQQKATMDVVDSEGNVICRKDKKFLKNILRKMRKAGMLTTEVREVNGVEQEVEIGVIPIREEDLIGKVSAYDLVDMNTGRILVECNEELTQESIAGLLAHGIEEMNVLFIDNLLVGSFLRDTLLVDKIASTEEAVVEIYRRLRSSDPPTYDTAHGHFQNLFFNPERYDLSRVGRHKLNHKLGVDVALDQTTLTRDDILEVVKYLIDLKNNKGVVDDIDHLGNRRVRAVGELLENQYRVGLDRMGKAIKERMSLTEIEAQMPNDIINSKPVTAVVKEFFGSSQLSQFMDQTNPLSEITHKRRLSALGPGGLTRERAGFDVRDVHPTHYGRICPIETPEGPNIGLIASLSTYARVNEFGFIETPYRRVAEGAVSPESARFFDAMEEEHTAAGKEHVIAQASAPTDATGKFVNEFVPARKGGEFVVARAEEVTLMDVAPSQLVSVASSLVPFLENDDANRALMGSNMMRQAVPVVRTEAPLVGTGVERVVARDSGVTVTARRNGVVESVDASRIVIKTEDDTGGEVGADVDIYNLTKFMRSNQNTCINQRPVVRPGDEVFAGDVIADGPATVAGELALGQNVIVAFMPWGGYNFEDSILINERMVREDLYTTIHIEEFEVAARDTKLGKEEITRDIPNVGDEALRNLDESGIIRIGAEVRQGDILVGKITPKGDTQLSPEEKLLRAIFGEKAGDVRDTSLRVPPGVEGTVIGAQVFTRESEEKDPRAIEIEAQGVRRIERDRDEKLRTIRESALRALVKALKGHKSAAPVYDPDSNAELLAAGVDLNAESLRKVPADLYDRIAVEDQAAEDELWKVTDDIRAKIDEVHARYKAKIERLKKGDELPPGVIKMVKIYVAIKRKLSVGDKMAGRHGNKGVISKILPVEDMPYLEDGTPVDIVLNPLGVPSRMNIGQIMEVHLGWAARGMGVKIGEMLEQAYPVSELRDYLKQVYARDADVIEFLGSASDDEVKDYAAKYKYGVTVATPVFTGANEDEIKSSLELAGFEADGQTLLYDGRTGDAFHQRVTVGVMYMLKLHHLVDDKIHARSIGPYSLVTQQPLGGKAQFGGQRLGEMEVWALEAYGAAYGLQEFLTVKSDDVAGRTRMYESIVKGENVLEAGLPESFNVLVKEMQALALDVELVEDREALR